MESTCPSWGVDSTSVVRNSGGQMPGRRQGMEKGINNKKGPRKKKNRDYGKLSARRGAQISGKKRLGEGGAIQRMKGGTGWKTKTKS